jgi:hypothetical protein
MAHASKGGIRAVEDVYGHQLFNLAIRFGVRKRSRRSRFAGLPQRKLCLRTPTICFTPSNYHPADQPADDAYAFIRTISAWEQASDAQYTRYLINNTLPYFHCQEKFLCLSKNVPRSRWIILLIIGVRKRSFRCASFACALQPQISSFVIHPWLFVI